MALGVIAGLEVLVFSPRGMVEWMISAGIVGAGLVIGRLAGFTG